MTDRTHQITLGGTPYRLHYTLGALRRLRKEFEIEFADFGDINEDQLLIGPWLYCGLKTHHPDLDLDTVEDLVDPENLLEVIEAMGEALTIAGAHDLDPQPATTSPDPSIGSPPSASPTASVG